MHYIHFYLEKIILLYFLLLLSIIFASSNSVLLHKLPQKSNIYILNMISSAIWLAILFCFNGFSLKLGKEIILFGILYGVIQEMFLFFKTQAMKNGAVSITTLIGNCSLLLSTTVGVIVWKENISVFQIIGIVFLIIAFFLCTYEKSDKKVSGKWILYSVFFFVFAAGVGIVFKAFSKSTGGSGAGDMMIFASLVIFLISSIKFAISELTDRDKKEKTHLNITKPFLAIAFISGVLSCVYNRLNVSLSGLLESAVFFPSFNGGVIILSAVLSLIFLKEKLTARQISGLSLGIVSIIIIGIL